MADVITSNTPSLALWEQVVLLYGATAWLEDLFTMQAHGRAQPSPQDFEEALLTQQALLALISGGLSSETEEAAHLRYLLQHSSITPLRDAARSHLPKD